MAEYTPSALSLLTAFFASDAIEQTARRTGFVKRVSPITGKIFLALLTFGAWSDAKTTLAQLAAKGTQLDTPVAVSPEAIHQRMTKRALAFLQALLRQALAKVQALDKVCDDGLFTDFTKMYLADSTGFGLPDSLAETFPGAGGSAAKAGAKIQAVWDYKSGVFGHVALTPWHMPDNKYIDKVVALAQHGVLFIFELGYFKVHALAGIVAAGAYFLSRLNHQTKLFEETAGQVRPFDLPRFLQTVRGTSRAKKTAKKRRDTPSKAHLALLAWNLFLTNVPATIWQTDTVGQVYPIRWQFELIFKSWKSALHLAALTTTKAAPTLCYLYGRMLLVLLNYALSPQIRAALWLKKKRELSLLKLMRHFQTLADRWLQALFQSPLALRRFLMQACATAERLAVKASRKRRTTAQLLRETLSTQLESSDLGEDLAA